ncbi:MAG: hypothetical protein KGI56_08475, partial [Acidobacteriota bacterium]|nr:hypothetical protein [Acidobacteriota bacterium]
GYPRCIRDIRETWDAFERETFTLLEAAEAAALRLPGPQGVAALAAFDQTRARAAIRALEDLLPRVKTLVYYEAF